MKPQNRPGTQPGQPGQPQITPNDPNKIDPTYPQRRETNDPTRVNPETNDPGKVDPTRIAPETQPQQPGQPAQPGQPMQPTHPQPATHPYAGPSKIGFKPTQRDNG